MRDLNSDLRRYRGASGGYTRRVRQGYLQGLSDVWSWNMGAVHQPDNRKGSGRSVRQPNKRVNWRVHSERGEVVAVEPNRDFEHVFDGDDPFQAALEFAAKQLREGA